MKNKHLPIIFCVALIGAIPLFPATSHADPERVYNCPITLEENLLGFWYRATPRGRQLFCSSDERRVCLSMEVTIPEYAGIPAHIEYLNCDKKPGTITGAVPINSAPISGGLGF
jgi:hypothetical protein